MAAAKIVDGKRKAYSSIAIKLDVFAQARPKSDVGGDRALPSRGRSPHGRSSY
jgi:hypothetical protein